MINVSRQQFLAAVTTIGPMLLPLVPGGAAIAPYVADILHAVADIEQEPRLSGPEKRAYVQRIVADGARVANQVTPDAVDLPLVVEAAGHYVDAILGSINAVQQAKAAMPHVPPIVPIAPPGA